MFAGFNLSREANPLATGPGMRGLSEKGCFNLSREANPLATPISNGNNPTHGQFQSQSRSQSSGDQGGTSTTDGSTNVSISVEKPILWRPVTFCIHALS